MRADTRNVDDGTPRLIVRGGDLVSGEPHRRGRNCDGGPDRFNGLVIDYGILWLARRQA